MTHAPSPPGPDIAWAAFAARDRTFDGRFVAGVASTRIYCRPSCPARRPRREGVAFFADGAAAQAAGYRACRRCTPDAAARDEAAVTAAAALLDQGETPTLAQLAARVGYAPHHLQRLFTRALGVSPAAYARGVRLARAEGALASGGSVTDAVYQAGYSGPSRFYAAAKGRLGMMPSTRAAGGAGELVRWTVAGTSLGPLLIAATDKGLCRVAFDEDEQALRLRFPKATVERGDAALADLAARVIAAVDRQGRGDALPLDIRGTAFQERVWRALAEVPPGETITYRELAARAGNAGAVRAAGSACGANPVAVIVPCHRARRSDGGDGGYAWGLERKRALLAKEFGLVGKPGPAPERG